MTTSRRTFLAATCALPLTSALLHAQERREGDSLPSWNDGAAKKSILDFVAKTTKEGSPDSIKSSKRIAVFDNDGTLWPENPVPFQLAFALDSLKQEVVKNPKLKDDPFVKAALDGDAPALLADHYKGLFRVLGLTHAGLTTDEFDARVNDWLKTAKHPRFGKRYDECIYQPMLEVLTFLRANGFSVHTEFLFRSANDRAAG